jgi:polyhydroxyalkanoate synthesis regulator phasin
MPEPPPSNPDPDRTASESGVADSVRAAVERTMRATAGSAATTRDRAGEMVDEVVRRGRDAGSELARKGQEAGAEVVRRGLEATGEVGRRLELLEQRLAELEERLVAEGKGDDRGAVEGEEPGGAQAKPKAEG